MLLLPRIHQLAIGLFVPPGEARVAVHDGGAGMDVTHDALAGRHAGGKAMLNRMAGLIPGNHRIARQTQAPMARSGVRPRVDQRTVVAVNHVTSTAAAGAIVTGMVVGAKEV